MSSFSSDIVSCIKKQREAENSVQSIYPSHVIIQHNGQRIFAPSSDLAVPRPPRGTEIFVGNLPRNVYESELIVLFSKVNCIYNLRLMMDFSGCTRGFAFICYYQPEDAALAVTRFNHYMIRRSTKINVYLSVDNCRLFFGNVPRELSSEDIWKELYGIMEGLVDVIVYKEARNPERNRGFFFAEFENHGLAAVARRKLLAGNMTFWGQNEKVCVDWADPVPFVEPNILSQVTILYLKNVPCNFTSSELKMALRDILNTDEIERVYKRDHYAFVHFPRRAIAEAAYTRIKADRIYIASNKIEVEWARPEKYSKKTTLNKTPENLCMSVPPKRRKMVRKSKAAVGFSGYGSRSRSSSAASDWDLVKSASHLLAECFQSLSV